MKKPKVIYFADPMGDLQDEVDDILLSVENKTGLEIEFALITDEPPFKKSFDILFFDWGGMSVGNDTLGMFCREIIKIAEDKPGKIFIMTSSFTKRAMEDALDFLGNDRERPSNIYLGIESAKNAIKSFYSEANK